MVKRKGGSVGGSKAKKARETQIVKNEEGPDRSPAGESPKKPLLKKPPAFSPDSKGRRFWLIKSEPLTRLDDKTGEDVAFPLSEFAKVEREPWDGVRNYEARNNLLSMAVNDICLFYHSNCPKPGIVGIARVVQEAFPDESQFDPKSNHFDPKSKREEPKWWCPAVKFVGRLRHKVAAADLKIDSRFTDLALNKRGRLSVTPVSESHFKLILEISKEGDIEDDIDCEISRKYIVDEI
ncbi:unnamed protein product [Kuraishia capsulata CBS 1993]|uniref:EVE domain-containing protein n=1 Tax=Kuraishia capsulata CBS 1993 TaxID=1382522 RepID=W6MNY6_9ASCO|nr:uncharacterized protein KUCA_T00004366001 [Kuraishia capsulata CBS 1993]CDK28384.1 unnamed protein product [Kuraishia capsulata CBS 1993]